MINVKKIHDAVVSTVVSQCDRVNKVIISKRLGSIINPGNTHNTVCGIKLTVDEHLPGMYVLMFDSNNLVNMVRVTHDGEVVNLNLPRRVDTPVKECGSLLSCSVCGKSTNIFCSKVPAGGWGSIKCGRPVCSDCKCDCQEPTL